MNKLLKGRAVLFLLLPIIFSIFGAGCEAPQQGPASAQTQAHVQIVPTDTKTKELSIEEPVAQIEEVAQVVAAVPSSTVVAEEKASVQVLPPAQPLQTTEKQLVVPTAPNGTYTNVDGNDVARPYEAPSQPAGATAICRDGTYSFSQNRRGTCSHHGGVAEWL